MVVPAKRPHDPDRPLVCLDETSKQLIAEAREVEIAEQWRDDPALRNAPLTVGFEHDLQQAHHVCIIHPCRSR